MHWREQSNENEASESGRAGIQGCRHACHSVAKRARRRDDQPVTGIGEPSMGTETRPPGSFSLKENPCVLSLTELVFILGGDPRYSAIACPLVSVKTRIRIMISRLRYRPRGAMDSQRLRVRVPSWTTFADLQPTLQPVPTPSIRSGSERTPSQRPSVDSHP